jgi:predicted metalloprotease with PDZ domain
MPNENKIFPHYRVEIADAAQHVFAVKLTLPRPQAEQRLSLPVWIPGSYMVREFARHLSGLQAQQAGRELAVQQIDKCTWLVRNSGQAPLQLHWQVYAFDPSVRAAFLDSQRGFFNGTSLLLRAEGFEQQPQRLSLHALPRGWQVATAMPAAGRMQWQAENYDELVDHPFELGAFWRGEFVARGVPHEFVVAGAWPSFDGERLLRDAQAICETQIRFWHGRSKPPFTRYVFLLNAVEEGYGGLEHRASTALIAARKDLPRLGSAAAAEEGYRTLLGLISHEYFHTWNVKRLRPQEHVQLDYTRENHSELLWFFEGFTSYYDDLLLLRSGRISLAQYLGLLSKAISAVLATPGRKVQSLAQASFDAWTKYYRSDENTPNATVSYYTKGSLAALALDAEVRMASGGVASLDEVMRALWQSSGAARGEGGISEAMIVAALSQAAGKPMAAAVHAAVHGTADLPLERLLLNLGLRWRVAAADKLGLAWGLRVSESRDSGIQVKQVLAGSAAARAGLNAGDELLAINGWRCRAALDDARQWLQAGEAAELLVSRGQRILSLRLQPDAASAAPLVALELDADASASALALRQAWLGA